MTHCSPTTTNTKTANQIALVGNPNVGKSILFHRLTGKYVVVSNYPGTTVEITRGALKHSTQTTLIDTPGIVSFPPRSDDEAVTSKVLLEEKLDAILQVGDAKNLRRTLFLAVQLVEMGIPMTLALNMMDEAESRGYEVDAEVISNALGIPVSKAIATRGFGINKVINDLALPQVGSCGIAYPEVVEGTLVEIIPHLPSAGISPRALGLLYLSGDPTVEDWIASNAGFDAYEKLRVAITSNNGTEKIFQALIEETREKFITHLIRAAQIKNPSEKIHWGARLGQLSTHPVWGIPILLLVLYGMYWFVGVFGAGTLVGLLENKLFGEVINPWIIKTIAGLIPFPFLSEFLVGEYGIWTMGITYAFALLLPIVFTFFIVFGILEDSGYLPRLSILSNKVFALMGLNGQAVLPMVLGLGCVTMATMTTRILSRPRDRFLVTLLLALAIPCSAQLGVVLGMISGVSIAGAAIWGLVVVAIMLIVGWLAAKLVPGQRTPLMVELPPLRLPVFSNVLIKTLARVEWYVKEAVPLFLIGTILVFLLDFFKILPIIIHGLEPIVNSWLGLPPETATAFILGLMRRDFAATDLFLMQSQGLLNPRQVVVSITTITLFIPCIASIFMIVKERGIKIAMGMILFIFPLAILIGGLLNKLLVLINWNG